MEQKIREIVEDVFKTNDFKIINRLMGGRSNYTYVIEVDEDVYTLRIPGKNGHMFVNREFEKNNLKAVNNIRINNETIYLNTETGVKVSKYIDGKELNSVEIEKYYQDVADILHKVHNSHKFKNDYNPFDRLAKYESFCSDYNYRHEDMYYDVKGWILKHKDFLESNEKVTCHNDAQASNFILGDDNKIYLTDWEFAGNNDCYYDIACFADGDFDRAIKLLNCYEKNVTEEHIKRVYMWRIFQMLQWSNVAAYKDLIGLSQDLEIDFEYVSKSYIKQAAHLISELEKYLAKKY